MRYILLFLDSAVQSNTVDGFKISKSVDLHFPGKLNLAKMLPVKAHLTFHFDAGFPNNSCIRVSTPATTTRMKQKICETTFTSPYEINVLPTLMLHARTVAPQINNIVFLVTSLVPYESPNSWIPPKAELALEYAVDNDG